MSSVVRKIVTIAALVALPSAAVADVHWKVSGVFDDGTALTGTFAINTYGFLSRAALTTAARSPFGGFTYTTGNSSTSNTATSIDFQPGYTSDLHIVFASSLSGSGPDPIVSGYECVDSYSCYAADAPHVRMLVSGVATVPEPASWALLVAGFAVAGGTLRAQRRRIAA